MNSSVEIILTVGPESSRIGRQMVSADVLGNWRSDNNGSILDQILNLMSKGPTVVSSCSRSQCGSAWGRLHHSFYTTGCHWFELKSGNEVGIRELLI